MSNDLSAFFGGTAFTPATIDPQPDFDVLPPGKYPVLIEAAEVKQTKKATGHYIHLEMKVLDGPCKGRKVFDQINIDNPSAQCVEIGMRTLSALGRAIGLQVITNTDQLLNGVVVAHVKVKDNQNNVRTYSASGQQVSVASAPAPVHPSEVPPMAQPETYAAPQQLTPVTPAPVATPPAVPPQEQVALTPVPPWQK